MTTRNLKAGDAVEWDSAGGYSKGKVVKKLMAAAKVKGHVAKATRDDPQYLVKSTSGGEAIHKPEALKKAR